MICDKEIVVCIDNYNIVLRKRYNTWKGYITKGIDTIYHTFGNDQNQLIADCVLKLK